MASRSTADEADALVRRLGHRPDLQPHGGGLDLGVRHALSLDEAGRLAFRRHAQRHGDVLARRSRTRAASARSSTT